MPLHHDKYVGSCTNGLGSLQQAEYTTRGVELRRCRIVWGTSAPRPVRYRARPTALGWKRRGAVFCRQYHLGQCFLVLWIRFCCRAPWVTRYIIREQRARNDVAPIARLYRKIGQLKVDRDFLVEIPGS